MQRAWRGSPLDMDGTIDYRGVKEVVIEFENGDTDTFRPRLREEFRSYELQQMAAYLDAVTGSIRKSQNR